VSSFPASSGQILLQIDSLVAHAIGLGYPTWHTTGRGGCEPSRPVLNFETHCLTQCARIDFLRGLNIDDKVNTEWVQWYDYLPLFKEILHSKQRPRCKKGQGNAIEMIVGLAYAAFVDGKNLPPTQELRWPTHKSQFAWAAIFIPMTHIGVTVHREVPGELGQPNRFVREVFDEAGQAARVLLSQSLTAHPNDNSLAPLLPMDTNHLGPQ